MISESVRVVSVAEDHLVVESPMKTGCARCESGQGCGQGQLAALTNQPSLRVAIGSEGKYLYKPGDLVIVGFPEQSLLKGTFWVFVVPLLLMMLVATALQSTGLAEAWVVIGSLAALLVASMLARALGGLNENADQPVILSAASSECEEGEQ